MVAASKNIDDKSQHYPSSSDFERLSDKEIYGLAGRAFDRLDEHATAPDPLSYMVWFLYLAQSNERVVKAVDGYLKSNRPLGRREMARLYDDFVENRFADNAQMNISFELELSINAMDKLVRESTERNQNFHQTLTHTQDELRRASSADDLRAVTSRLMTGNSDMLNANAALSKGLECSRREISTLNRRLEELEAMTLQDPLTGIFNRRAFDARLRHEIETASAARPFSLAIIDIDHFKRINDLLGHQAGDRVLTAIAGVLRDFASEDIIVARYGGEEFSIILKNTDVYSAHNKLVRLKWLLSDMQCLSENDQNKIGFITASIGQSVYKLGRDAATLFEIADEKLFEAKRSGRNAVRSEGLGKVTRLSRTAS